MPATTPRYGRCRTIHPDAVDWVRRVAVNGGGVSPGTVAAASGLAVAVQNAQIRSLIGRMNLFVGNGLASCLVPFYNSFSFGGTVVGNATDTNNNFVSGDYNETGASSGLVGNGSTKFLNTGYPANTTAAASAHLGVGLRAVNSSASPRTAIGAYNGGANSFELGMVNSSAPSIFFTRFGTASDRMGDNSSGVNLSVGDIVAAWPQMYRNGSAAGSAATTSQDYPSAHAFYVFALNNSGTSTISHTNARLNWYSIGRTMTAAQALAFTNAVTAFNTTLQRT